MAGTRTGESVNYCEICGAPNAHRHHVFSRGAWGKAAEVLANIIFLCWKHHSEAHTLGRWTFADRYGLRERFESAEEAVREHQIQGLAS